jgi:hypothetical protein
MIPDAEAIVNAFLAEKLDAKIGTANPNGLSKRWVRTTLINGSKESKSTPVYLIPFHMQFDCFAGTGRNKRAEASDLARELWDALESLDGPHEGGTVTGVTFLGVRPLPDTSIDPVRERFVVEANVYIHP